MKKNKNLLLFLFLLNICACTYEKSEPLLCDNVNSNYTQSVVPIILTRCAVSGCHNGDSTSVGNFKNYMELKERVNNGLFNSKVIVEKSMPPPTVPALKKEEYLILKCWYDSGAPNN